MNTWLKREFQLDESLKKKCGKFRIIYLIFLYIVLKDVNYWASKNLKYKIVNEYIKFGNALLL